MMNIGNRVYTRRKELHLSQAELAKRMGYSTDSTISKIEKGQRGVPLTQIEKLADALECSAEYLLGFAAVAEADEQMTLDNGDIVYVRYFAPYKDGDRTVLDGKLYTLYKESDGYLLIAEDGTVPIRTHAIHGKVIARLIQYEV